VVGIASVASFSAILSVGSDRGFPSGQLLSGVPCGSSRVFVHISSWQESHLVPTGLEGEADLGANTARRPLQLLFFNASSFGRTVSDHFASEVHVPPHLLHR
jgi:hypothetical protein